MKDTKVVPSNGLTQTMQAEPQPKVEEKPVVKEEPVDVKEEPKPEKKAQPLGFLQTGVNFIAATLNVEPIKVEEPLKV